VRIGRLAGEKLTEGGSSTDNAWIGLFFAAFLGLKEAQMLTAKAHANF
jgi:hypothetical protein